MSIICSATSPAILLGRTGAVRCCFHTSLGGESKLGGIDEHDPGSREREQSCGAAWILASRLHLSLLKHSRRHRPPPRHRDRYWRARFFGVVVERPKLMDRYTSSYCESMGGIISLHWVNEGDFSKHSACSLSIERNRVFQRHTPYTQ